jgi:prepilin-type N-terminal cleavage/methylation domain-containing protein
VYFYKIIILSKVHRSDENRCRNHEGEGMKEFKQIKWASRAGFTIIELLFTVSIAGILASVAIPAFQKHLLNARRSEATLSVAKITERVTVFFNRYHAFPPPAARTPAAVAPGYRNEIATYNATFMTGAGWEEIGFCPAADFYYSYTFEPECSTAGPTCEDGMTAHADAEGDLDADGDLSLFTQNMTILNGKLLVGPILIMDETE